LRPKKGFTLVEVIVVLVILAILAAIAIPALTGYIEKAKWTGVVSLAKTQMTAMQTLITDQLVRDGEIKPHNWKVNLNDITAHADYNDQDYFKLVDYWKDSSNNEIGYYFSSLTPRGQEEYEKLTTDKNSVKTHPTIQNYQTNYFYATADFSGAIKAYQYTSDLYFDAAKHIGLLVIYLEDADSGDPVTQSYIDWFEGLRPTTGELESGWTVWKFGTAAYNDPSFTERIQ
jgi:prepilin-type N-terminal cleavage/methylation domain-containing protein